MDAAITVLGTLLVGAIIAQVRHIVKDDRRDQEVKDLKARVAKLDGINGR